MKAAPQLRRDSEIAWLAVLAVFVSVVSFLFYLRKGDILLFGDAVAHINIARRVFDSRTPGLLQLGTVWLPLPHLIMIPFLLSDWAWETGIGGSIPSMVAYALGVVGVFRLVRSSISASIETKNISSATAWLAAAIYGLNPNLLYLQTTAMTESLYLALFIWSIVYLCEFLIALRAGEWSHPAKGWLGKCAACLAAASLTRYDGWCLSVCIGALVVLVAFRAGNPLAWRTAIRFVLLAAAAPILWLAYNGMVYKNPLEFANGPYSARAIERRTSVPGFPHPGTNNPAVAALYFVKAGEFSVAEGGWQQAWCAAAVAGAILLLLHDRASAGLLLLWVPVPFYMLSVAYGGVPIFTPAWRPHSLYNIRYGVQLLPALAVFLALAVHYGLSLPSARPAKWAIAGASVAIVMGGYASAWRARPSSYREAWINSRTRLQTDRAVAEQLARLPADATVLMYLGEHVGALQDAGILLRRTINEGNHRVWKQPVDPEGLWERALADPAKYTDFAIAFEGDPVWQAVHDRGLPAVIILAVNGQHRATIYRTR